MQREINRNHTGDWDEQRERLSAYLDGELDEGEREALERHLPTCEQCQRTLDEFRVVRTLLRAMPLPTPSQSFVIPTEGTIPVPLADAARERSKRTEQQQQRTHRSVLWSSVAQAMGRFVVAAGLILVLGSLLMGRVSQKLGSYAPASGSGASGAHSSAQYDNTSTPSSLQQSTPNAPQATAKAVEQGNTTPTATAGSSQQQLTRTPDSSSEELPVVPIGAGMVAGGMVLLVAGRVSKSRRKRGEG